VDAARPHCDHHVCSLDLSKKQPGGDRDAARGDPLAEVDSRTDQLAAAEEPVAFGDTGTGVEGRVTWSCIGAAAKGLAMQLCIAIEPTEGTRDSWAGSCVVHVAAGRRRPLASPYTGGLDWHTEGPRSKSLSPPVSS
jgi:hypothetical protein